MDKEQEKAAKARDAALNGALSQIERQFGKGSIMRMGDEDAAVRVDAISTGALSLDIALGVGGMPRGRIVEVFGPESSGKTTLLYHLLSEAQKKGGICAFIDAEHAMDPAYAKRIGLDIDELLDQLVADRPSSTRGVDGLVQPCKLMHRDRVEADSVSGRCQLVCKGSEHLVLPLAVLALSHSLTDTEVGVVR